MLKGYLPPEGPQNIHRVPYTWMESQGAHRVDNSVLSYGPEEIILTGDENAHRRIEQAGLEPVPQEVAQAALEAHQGKREQSVAQVIEEWHAQSQSQNQAEPEEAEADPEEDADKDEPEPEDADEDEVAIPSDEELEELPYRGQDEVTLQHLSQIHGVPANQAADDLRAQLRDVRESEPGAGESR